MTLTTADEHRKLSKSSTTVNGQQKDSAGGGQTSVTVKLIMLCAELSLTLLHDVALLWVFFSPDNSGSKTESLLSRAAPCHFMHTAGEYSNPPE